MSVKKKKEKKKCLPIRQFYTVFFKNKCTADKTKI